MLRVRRNRPRSDATIDLGVDVELVPFTRFRCYNGADSTSGLTEVAVKVGALLLTFVVANRPRVLWCDLMLGELSDCGWWFAANPFLGMWLVAALLTPHVSNHRQFGGVHWMAAGVGSFVAVIANWVVTAARHPALVLSPERRREVRAAV
jgi:hypothetical protein